MDAFDDAHAVDVLDEMFCFDGAIANEFRDNLDGDLCIRRDEFGSCKADAVERF